MRLDEVAAASAKFDKNGNGVVSAKELQMMRDGSADEDCNDDDNNNDDADDADAAVDGKGTEPILRLKMELGRGGQLDVGRNIMKDDDDVMTVLGQPSHLNVQALHRSLTLEKM
jgi:hypothetical protein